MKKPFFIVSSLFAVPPSIDERLASPYNMTVLKDGAIIIDCPINGVPDPDITWYKDGLQLQVRKQATKMF